MARPSPQLLWSPDFPGLQPTARPVVYQRHGWPTLLRPSIARTLRSWCRNVDLLSIAYDFRPRLRSRLTLGRLTLPRNPWAFGGQVSRLSLVTHASILSPDTSTAWLTPPLRSLQDAPLPLQSLRYEVRGFGKRLKAR
jgi:hypothetical protein